MKWVFMQPSAQFKLEQSTSTDGISNQSTTQARRGRHCANEFRRAEEISKKEATKTEPTSCNSFHYRVFFPPSFSLSPLFEKIAETKDHKILTEGPLRASWGLTAKREEVIFREDFFFFFSVMFSATSFSGRKGN